MSYWYETLGTDLDEDTDTTASPTVLEGHRRSSEKDSPAPPPFVFRKVSGHASGKANRALPTEKNVESETSQSKSGASVNLTVETRTTVREG